MYRAELAAMLGERALAVRMLQQATAEGNPFEQNMHITHELQRLRGYAPFEEWLRPKG